MPGFLTNNRVGLGWALGGALLAGVVGLGTGWLLGQASALQGLAPILALVQGSDTQAPNAGPGPPIADAENTGEQVEEVALSWQSAMELAARVRSLEALLADLDDKGIEPRKMLSRVIDNASDDQLEAVIMAATRLRDDDLDAVHDLPAFANRLAEIALRDIVDGAADADEDGQGAGQAGDVIFSTSNIEGEGSATVFSSDLGRLYAVFSTESRHGRQVMVKWFRADQPKILLFRRYDVNPGVGRNWVWLDREGGWRPGVYQVDVFSGDEAMQAVASGRYTVE